jgi:hypothetical protein
MNNVSHGILISLLRANHCISCDRGKNDVLSSRYPLNSFFNLVGKARDRDFKRYLVGKLIVHVLMSGVYRFDWKVAVEIIQRILPRSGLTFEPMFVRCLQNPLGNL